MLWWIDEGGSFPYLSWLRQAFPTVGPPTYIQYHTLWPLWKPKDYGCAVPSSQRGPVRHGCAIAVDAPGIHERFTAWEWDYGGAYGGGYDSPLKLDTPTINPPDEGSYWLIEPDIESIALTGLLALDGGVYVPNASTAYTNADMQNGARHLNGKPPPVGIGSFADGFYFRETGRNPWNIKDATVGKTSKRLSAQVAYIAKLNFYGGEGDNYNMTALRTWNGSAWTLIPNVANDPGETWNCEGWDYYSVTCNEETGLLESAQLVPLGKSQVFDSFATYINGIIFGLTWPLSIRNIRTNCYSYWTISVQPYPPYTPVDVKAKDNCKIYWRPAGGYSWAAIPANSANPSYGQVDRYRTGCPESCWYNFRIFDRHDRQPSCRLAIARDRDAARCASRRHVSACDGSDAGRSARPRPGNMDGEHLRRVRRHFTGTTNRARRVRPHRPRRDRPRERRPRRRWRRHSGRGVVAIACTMRAWHASAIRNPSSRCRGDPFAHPAAIASRRSKIMQAAGRHHATSDNPPPAAWAINARCW
jgi:hypothetical protein